MVGLLHTVSTGVQQAWQELRANKLRTFLSLTGITIGIFSIVAVLTVLDSLETSIRKSMNTLGADVLYVNRRPWMAENGEYKWWEYLQRKPLSLTEMKRIQAVVPGVKATAFCYFASGLTLKYNNNEVSGILAYAVTDNFEQIQDVEVVQGRYLATSELQGGGNSIVVGGELAASLFGASAPIGKDVSIAGRTYRVVGLLKKTGQNMAGFNFDEAIIMPYYTAASMYDVHSLNWGNDPMILVKVSKNALVSDVQDEMTGVLRGLRRVSPGAKNNFAINQLSEVTASLDSIFASINAIGFIIAFFSLLVGSFGVANIMFVTVKERTKFIGLKKAIGAHRMVILTEFLIEAIILCVIGGVIGIILVYLLGLILTHAADFEVVLSVKNIIIGIFTSAIVGVLAGFVPAFRASRLDPVVAIRSS